MRRASKLRAAAGFLLRSDREPRVSPKWLFRTHTKLFRSFIARHKIEVERTGEFTFVCVDGLPFVWPPKADVEPLKHLLAELLTENHPHQYDHGLTRLGPKEVLLDVGCCEGGFAAMAAARGAKVIAIEPSKMMGVVIRRLFALRGLPSPEIRRCVLSDETGFVFFQDNAGDPARSQISTTEIADSERVEATTMDELIATLANKPTYIKCDAEGADLRILRGGRNYLEQFRPKVAVTTYHAPEHFREIGHFLRSLGYEVQAKGLMFVEGEMRVMMIHAA